MNQINKILCLLVIMGLFACKSNTSNNTSNEFLKNGLSDKLATVEAVMLYHNMGNLAKSKIMIGHQDALAYGMGWRDEEFKSDINEVCGDYPAVFGWDLGHIGDSTNIDNVSFEKMKIWALKAYENGGVNTYGWHSRNFKNDSSSWNTQECVKDILPGGEKHNKYLEKLSLVADFFSELKNKQGEAIPVLFRPFHEMNGGWFWWGAQSCSPKEYKDLWRFTVDYLRNERDLHNIIYIYSTDVFNSADDYLTYYPGDDYVDILGYDDYKGLNESSNTYKTIKMLETLADLSVEKNKIYTISETGLETIPNELWFTDVVLSTLKTNAKTMGISYVLFWRNGRPDHFYAPYPGHSSANNFLQFKNDTTTIFLSQIKNIYSQDL